MMCAVCMWMPAEDRTNDGFAITIRDGWAVCTEHALDSPLNVESYKVRVASILADIAK